MRGRWLCFLAASWVAMLHSAPYRADNLEECRRIAPFRAGTALGYPDWYKDAKRDQCSKEWLVLVYMAADNDLSPFSAVDLLEMEKVGSTTAVDVVVFQDRWEDDGLRYYHVAQGGSPLVKSLPEGDSGSSHTVADFLRWGLTHYPARRVLFIGWSHGEGFDGRWNRTRGGFAFDVTSGTHLKHPELGVEIEAVLKETRAGNALDLIAVDACSNQQLETALEWRGITDYLFGSPAVVEDKGLDYRLFLNELTSYPYYSTRAVAEWLPRIYLAGMTPELKPFALVSSLRSSEIESLWSAHLKLAADLESWLTLPKKRVERIRRREFLRGLFRSVVRTGATLSDYSDFLSALVEGSEEEEWPLPGIRRHVVEVRRALRRSVVKAAVGDGYRGEGYPGGVGIWLPTSVPDFQELYPKYARSRFYSGPNAWARVLELLFPKEKSDTQKPFSQEAQQLDVE